MQTRPDRAGWDAEDLGRLVEAESEVVVEHEDRPLVGVEAAEAALELIAVGETEARVGFGTFKRPDVDLDAPPPLGSTRFAIAGVDQQSVEPGVEAVGIAQAGDMRPGGDERLLGASSALASSRRISRATT